MSVLLYVGNLPFQTVAAAIESVFARGSRRVLNVALLSDADTGRSRGMAFVEMGSAAEAHAAIHELHGARIGGRVVTVGRARKPKN